MIATLKDGQSVAGYFAGLIVRKLGLKILGSPFVGWATERMGLRLLPGVPRREAIEALMRYAFHDLGCVHLEFSDLHTTPDDVAGLGFDVTVNNDHFVDLRPDEEEIYRNMNRSARRYCNREGPARGLVVEEAYDEEFAKDFCSQMTEVFARRGLVPTFGEKRVLLLMRHLLPTGNLLLLRARFRRTLRCDGPFSGSQRSRPLLGQRQRPGHAATAPQRTAPLVRHVPLEAPRHASIRNGRRRIYGKVRRHTLPAVALRRSKFRWIGHARNLAETGYRLYQRLAGVGKRKDAGQGEEGL